MVQIVTLPNFPAPLEGATFSLKSWASDLSGPLGGASQRVLRLGSRFSLDLQYPAMTYDVGRQWLSRLLAGEANPVAVRFPQRGFKPSWPGNLIIDGSQPAPLNTGGQIAVRNGEPGFFLLDGQFFHITSQRDGRRYVHQVVGNCELGAADGAAVMSIQPLLRFQPSDGDQLEFVNPVLEGFLRGPDTTWSLEMVRRVGIKLSITEDR